MKKDKEVNKKRRTKTDKKKYSKKGRKRQT